MRKWAIAIGINHYQFLQPLSYAQEDAQELKAFWVNKAGFVPDHCLLLTDTSPPLGGRPTYPTRQNILHWLDLLTQQYLQPGDLLWVFFSGCGVCWQGKDYLMPIDGDPARLVETAIPLESFFSRLKTIGAEPLLVLLDMTRSEGSLSQEVVGVQTAQLAQNLEIPTILSCQPGQFSRETSLLGHGFFATALLEGLHHYPQPTFEDLARFVSDRVPQLSEHFWRPIQQPLAISSSPKLHQPILAQMPISRFHTATRAVSTPWEQGTAATPHPDLAATETEPEIGGVTQATSSQHGDAGNQVNPQNSSEVSVTGQDIEDSPVGRSLWWGSVAAVTLVLAGGVCWKNWVPLTQGSHVMAKKSAGIIANQKLPSQAHPQIVAAQPATAAKPQQPFSLSANAIGSQGDDSRPISYPIPQPSATSQTSLTVRSQPQKAVVKPGVTSAPVEQSANQKTSGSTPQLPQPIATAPDASHQSVLAAARAQIAINSNQASPYWYAIQDASQIKRGDPQYQEAQREIAGWSQDILTIANWRAKQRSFDTAIIAAALISPQQAVYATAQKAIARWCPSLAQPSQKGSTHQRQAKAICLHQ